MYEVWNLMPHFIHYGFDDVSHDWQYRTSYGMILSTTHTMFATSFTL